MIPNIDLVQEFKVVGHDAKAEFDGATGGVMNMVSKSGGNSFHGSAFEYVSMEQIQVGSVGPGHHATVRFSLDYDLFFD